LDVGGRRKDQRARRCSRSSAHAARGRQLETTGESSAPARPATPEARRLLERLLRRHAEGNLFRVAPSRGLRRAGRCDQALHWWTRAVTFRETWRLVRWPAVPERSANRQGSAVPGAAQRMARSGAWLVRQMTFRGAQPCSPCALRIADTAARAAPRVTLRGSGQVTPASASGRHPAPSTGPSDHRGDLAITHRARPSASALTNLRTDNLTCAPSTSRKHPQRSR